MTQERLSNEDRRFLGAIAGDAPLHAWTMRDSCWSMPRRAIRMDEYAEPDVDFWARRLADVDANVICVGHTHHPYVARSR